MHSEPAGAAKVIARANPIMLGTGWLACGVGLLIHIRVFEAQGWLNPEAFVGLQETRQAWFTISHSSATPSPRAWRWF